MRNSNGIDESVQLKPGEVQAYAEARAKHGGVSYNHSEPRSSGSEFGKDLMAKVYESGQIAVNILLNDNRPIKVLHVRGLITDDHFLAAEFIKNLRDVAFNKLGYPVYRDLIRMHECEFMGDIDPMTVYVRIMRDLSKVHANIIEQACWPMQGRNTLGWLSHYSQSTLGAFDALVYVLDNFREKENTASDDKPQVPLKSGQPA